MNSQFGSYCIFGAPFLLRLEILNKRNHLLPSNLFPYYVTDCLTSVPYSSAYLFPNYVTNCLALARITTL